jgi:hypothetical protein
MPDYTVSHSIKQKSQVHCNGDVLRQMLCYSPQLVNDIQFPLRQCYGKTDRTILATGYLTTRPHSHTVAINYG